MTRNGTLTARQSRALAAMLTSRTIVEAAKTSKVGERTLKRWLTDETFKTELRAAESAMIEQASRRELTLQQKALDILENIMDDKSPLALKEKRHVAEGVRDRGLKLRDRTIEDRIAALEARDANHQQKT